MISDEKLNELIADHDCGTRSAKNVPASEFHRLTAEALRELQQRRAQERPETPVAPDPVRDE